MKGFLLLVAILSLVACSAAPRRPGVEPAAANTPAGTPTPVSDATWAELARRPLKPVALGTDDTCPTSISHGDASDPALPATLLGDGPLFAILSPRVDRRSWGREDGGWYYLKVLWMSRASYQGPAVIRGRQVDGPHELRFEDGSPPASELRFPAGLTGAQGHDPAKWRDLPSYARFAAPGCYQLQVDGPDFSYTIVFEIES
jgi:hypothetical protein